MQPFHPQHCLQQWNKTLCKEFGRFLNGDILVSHTHVVNLKMELNNVNKNNETVNNFQRNIMEVKNKCASMGVHVVDKEILHSDFSMFIFVDFISSQFDCNSCFSFLVFLWIYCINVFCQIIAKMGDCKIWSNTIILITQCIYGLNLVMYAPCIISEI